MTQRQKPWDRTRDDLLRSLVDAGVRPEEIAERLGKTVDDLKRRGYIIGLPLKWFAAGRR